MGNCIQTNLITNSDFSISVSAVTVDKATLQDVPGHALIHWHLENPLSHWHGGPINNVFEFLWHLFGGFF